MTEPTVDELRRQLDELNDANDTLRAIVHALEDIETITAVTAQCPACGTRHEGLTYEHARVGDRLRDAIRIAASGSAASARPRELPRDAGMGIDRLRQQRLPEDPLVRAAAVDRAHAGLQLLQELIRVQRAIAAFPLE